MNISGNFWFGAINNIEYWWSCIPWCRFEVCYSVTNFPCQRIQYRWLCYQWNHNQLERWFHWKQLWKSKNFRKERTIPIYQSHDNLQKGMIHIPVRITHFIILVEWWFRTFCRSYWWFKNHPTVQIYSLRNQSYWRRGRKGKRLFSQGNISYSIIWIGI